MDDNDELQVKCPLCSASQSVACKRYNGQPGSHPERVVELLLYRARHGGGPVGYELWNALMAETAKIPEGRRQAWEKQYLAEVRRICFGG